MHSLLKKLLLTAVLLLAGPAMAGEAFIAGTHYAVIDVPVATGLEETAPAQVEVVEVFSYMCIHCYSFDPLLQRWEEDKPEGAAFSRLPAVFSDDWALMARAFYTAEILGVAEQMHGPLFQAIHVEPQNIRSEQVMAGLFNESAGVAEEAFSKAYNSFFVRSRVMQARSKSRAYGLNSVPTMIVNGKYRVDGRMAGSNQAMLDVVNFLVEREREAN
ncbi:MAG TPA: disulfide bond formation protein DsbA [Gammaproteobacteria bacterium]|jgi:thiol:disulfide interchange protein DsbA|nr:disulfide bond formation protein DsbA [Gammaproteobacteria bacterium]HCG69908.1 disulfide bond formation protein DsbA [Gammaproteobacteria bacterium]